MRRVGHGKRHGIRRSFFREGFGRGAARSFGELSERVNLAEHPARPEHVDRLAGATDALLAARASDGDEQAFETLLRRHLSLMTAYATRLTGSRADAYDAVQEASVAIWRELPGLSTPEAVRGWMMRIVSRKSFDLIRARKPAADVDDEAVASRLPVDAAADPASLATTNGAMAGLKVALDALPPLQRQSWILREIGGESYAEIGQRLGITTTAARGQLARARETLTREMEAWR